MTLPSGVNAWLGVPFAAPPLRELRWQPPQPVKPWAGVYHADRFAPQRLQPLRSPRQNHYFGNEATSEDCLYLNVWAPKSAKKLPVVVWVYGGGFNIGSASMANYSGEPLARAGVVRVNIAYRVGALGFMAHPELAAGKRLWRLGQLWPDGPDCRPAMGQTQYREVRRRSGQRHHRRAVGGLDVGRARR